MKYRSTKVKDVKKICLNVYKDIYKFLSSMLKKNNAKKSKYNVGKNSKRKNNSKSFKKRKTIKISPDGLLIIVFSTIVLSVFLCILNPFCVNDDALVKSNIVSTKNMKNGIKKVKVELENKVIKSFPYYTQLVKGYFATTLLLNSNSKSVNDDELILINRKNAIYTDAKKTYLIKKYEIDDTKKDKEIARRIKFFNNVYKKLNGQNKNMYIYAVSGIWTSEAILNFDVDEREPLKYVDIFKSKINKDIKFDYLKIIDFTTYKKYFFKTDHHWTIQGAYKGYLDLAKMLGINQKDLVPPKFYKINGVHFKGSNARVCAYDKIYDELYDIEFDDNEYDVRVNGKKVKKSEFTKAKDYENGKYEKEEFFNHYSSYFRDDTGEVVYTFEKNKDEGNLLLIADSFSNCMEKLIASHFYKTYVVDLRYYEEDNGEKFNLYKYVEKNKIDNVVFICSANCIYFESADIKIE